MIIEVKLSFLGDELTLKDIKKYLEESIRSHFLSKEKEEVNIIDIKVIEQLESNLKGGKEL